MPSSVTTFRATFANLGRVMRNAVRVVNAMIAAAAALILVAPATQANVMDEIVIAHRG
jgi:hypothetical protein